MLRVLHPTRTTKKIKPGKLKIKHSFFLKLRVVSPWKVSPPADPGVVWWGNDWRKTNDLLPVRLGRILDKGRWLAWSFRPLVYLPTVSGWRSTKNGRNPRHDWPYHDQSTPSSFISHPFKGPPDRSSKKPRCRGSSLLRSQHCVDHFVAFQIMRFGDHDDKQNHDLEFRQQLQLHQIAWWALFSKTLLFRFQSLCLQCCPNPHAVQCLVFPFWSVLFKEARVTASLTRTRVRELLPGWSLEISHSTWSILCCSDEPSNPLPSNLHKSSFTPHSVKQPWDGECPLWKSEVPSRGRFDEMMLAELQFNPPRRFVCWK